MGFSVIFALSVVFAGWWGRALTTAERGLLTLGAAIMALAQNTSATELFLLLGTLMIGAVLIRPTRYWISIA